MSSIYSRRFSTGLPDTFFDRAFISSVPRTATGFSLIVDKSRTDVGESQVEPIQTAVGQAKEVTMSVESADPRKLMLLPYVNASLLPDPPVDGDDVSTEACWKRQAHTIAGLLKDLQQKNEEANKAGNDLYEAHKEICRLGARIEVLERGRNAQSTIIDNLRRDVTAYKADVLRNQESVAVAKQHRSSGEWHVIKNGIAYNFGTSKDGKESAMLAANQINTGERKAYNFIANDYYFKEDYD